MSLASDISAYGSAAIQCGLAAASAGTSTGNAGLASKCATALQATFSVLSSVNDLHRISTGAAPVTPTTAADLTALGVNVPQNANDAEVERIARESQAVITEMRRQTMEDLRTRMTNYHALFDAQKEEERTYQYLAAASAVVLLAGIGTSYYFYSNKKGSI